MKLEKKEDERGWLVELLKKKDLSKFGQISLSITKPGFKRGGHYHTRKNEWFCVIKGKGELILKDIKTNKVEKFILDSNDLQIIKIPPNKAHIIQNISDEDMYLLIHVDEQFDKKDPDTFPFS